MRKEKKTGEQKRRVKRQAKLNSRLQTSLKRIFYFNLRLNSNIISLTDVLYHPRIITRGFDLRSMEDVYIFL